METDDSGEDHNDVRNTIVIFHFSGNYCLPWEYMDLSKEETTKCLQKRYGFRDPRGRVSHAIIAWCESVRTLHKTRTTALIQVLSKAVEQLKQQAYQMRRWQTHWCDRCNRAAETFAVGDDAIWLCALCAAKTAHCGNTIRSPKKPFWLRMDLSLGDGSMTTKTSPRSLSKKES